VRIQILPIRSAEPWYTSLLFFHRKMKHFSFFQNILSRKASDRTTPERNINFSLDIF